MGTHSASRQWTGWSVLLVVGMLLSVGVAPALVSAHTGVRSSDAVPGTLANPVALAHDVSRPLRDIVPDLGQVREPLGEVREFAHERERIAPGSSGPDTAVQSSEGDAASPGIATNFLGLGQGFKGPQGSFNVRYSPPDANGDVGPNHFVQIVNARLAVFSKDGTVLLGPIKASQLFQGFDSPCAKYDSGDGTVKYDRLADRWIVTQFRIGSLYTNQCVAVSTGPDPTGSYYRYDFGYNFDFIDYPKLAVWPDAYYITFNNFGGILPIALSRPGPLHGYPFGVLACAYDRARMLAGEDATQQCFTPKEGMMNALPSDLDGSTPPPTGSPNYLLHADTGKLQLWTFHVDFERPSRSLLGGPYDIPVAAYTPACEDGGTCIRQPNKKQDLDSLGDRLMYRLAYRNFGDHESLVANQSVKVGSTTGIRWYELQHPGADAFVYQQATYAPDATQRWMGSIAQDKFGDIALGYSVSSRSIFPSIRFTGRLSSDPPGQMTATETTIFNGAGSQKGIDRWGDYTSMAVDPVDDCTFWYTNEYLTKTGNFNWSTRIASFRFPSCV
jgi:hypothetical protein